MATQQEQYVIYTIEDWQLEIARQEEDDCLFNSIDPNDTVANGYDDDPSYDPMSSDIEF